MSPENNNKLKLLFKQYLDSNSMHIYKEIWASYYAIKENKGVKYKIDNNDYIIENYLKNFTLAIDSKSHGYKFWKLVYQKDIHLAFEMIPEYIKIPNKDYERPDYIDKVFHLYTRQKKENKVLWSIVNTKSFLNNNINVVEQLFKEEVLNNTQKQLIVEHYVALINKPGKFVTLENKRIITILNEQLSQPLSIHLIEEKNLSVQTTAHACVYFEARIKDLMSYSLKLSSAYSENLLIQFATLLPQVIEAETHDVITKKLESNAKCEGYGYAILTKLNENMISKVFTSFVDSYIKIVDSNNFLSTEESLDCLKFAVIKARKENLENKLIVKNIKSPTKKI